MLCVGGKIVNFAKGEVRMMGVSPEVVDRVLWWVYKGNSWQRSYGMYKNGNIVFNNFLVW